MTSVNTFKLFSNFITGKVNSGNTISPSQFDIVCDQSQLFILSRDYETFVQTGVVSNFLQSFLTVGTPFSLNPISPTIPYPSDFEYLSSVGTYYDRTQIDAESVDNVEWRKMLRPNSLNLPTLRHPKYQQTGAGILFAPANAGICYLDYFKTPASPHWAYTIVNNKEVYNPTGTVDFEWDKVNINQVMGVYLSFIGINLKDIDISGFATAFKTETSLPL